MNTSELSSAVAEKTGQSAATVKLILDAAFDSIADAVADDTSVALSGFGTFEARERAARTGRNPQTGESMDIPASRSVGFRPYPALKARIRDAK